MPDQTWLVKIELQMHNLLVGISAKLHIILFKAYCLQSSYQIVNAEHHGFLSDWMGINEEVI